MLMLTHLRFKENLLVFLYFLTFFIIGLIIYPDYGISIDEDNTRLGGFVSLKYIFQIFFTQYESSIDNIITVPSMVEWKEWSIGPVFDIPAAFIEWAFEIKDSRNYYLMRHFLNFLFFFLSVFIFFLLIKDRFNSYTYGILGSTFLIFSPRIFSNSFYNNKDIVFMALYVIAIYVGLKFLRKPNISNSLLFSLTTALAIDIRITGIILPLIILVFYIMNILRDDLYKKKSIKPLIVFLFVTPIFIIIFWPYLWSNPLINFLAAFQTLSNFDVNVYNYYFGEYISAKNLPWHYPFVWIFITTPLLYVFLFFIGFVFLLTRIIRRLVNFEDDNKYKDVWRGKNEFFDLVIIVTFLAPLFYIIVFNSTLYDGWRHIFFIYPSFIYISLLGIYILNLYFFKKRKNLLFGILFILIIPIALWMYKNHPYQNIYFNFLADKNFNKKFEMDYWGLSNTKALELIAINENKKVNVSSVGTSDLVISHSFIDKILRNRISIVNNIENSNYIINHYRNWLGDNINMNFVAPLNFIKFHEIKVDGITINTIYKKNE